METGTYGYKYPESGDKGKPVFDAINGNFEKAEDHSHNGTDSKKISSQSIQKGSITLSAAEWSVVTNGYKQTVSLPSPFTLTNCVLSFRITAGPNIYKTIHPTVIPLSATQIEVYINQPLELEMVLV